MQVHFFPIKTHNFYKKNLFLIKYSIGLENNDNYTSVLMQGSGTFGVESVMQTVCKPNHTKFLILENGAYGQRMAKMCKLIGVEYQMESFPENRSVDLNRVESILKKNNKFTNVVSIQS